MNAALRIQKLVDTVPGVQTKIEIPEGGNRYPTLVVSWDEDAWGFTVGDCDAQLRAGEPRIEVLTRSNPSLVSAVVEGSDDDKTPKRADQIRIISMTIQPGEDLVVGKRLREILMTARKKKS